VAEGAKMIHRPPFLPDLAPVDLFLFLRVKSELAGLALSQYSFQKSWERVVRTIAHNESAAAFWWGMERYEKCVWIVEHYVKKYKKLIEINNFLKLIRITVISFCAFDSDHTLYS
jgi:hypothetical protein